MEVSKGPNLDMGFSEVWSILWLSKMGAIRAAIVEEMVERESNKRRGMDRKERGISIFLVGK